MAHTYNVIPIIVCKTISNLRWINICLCNYVGWNTFNGFSQLIGTASLTPLTKTTTATALTSIRFDFGLLMALLCSYLLLLFSNIVWLYTFYLSLSRSLPSVLWSKRNNTVQKARVHKTLFGHILKRFRQVPCRIKWVCVCKCVSVYILVTCDVPCVVFTHRTVFQQLGFCLHYTDDPLLINKNTQCSQKCVCVWERSVRDGKVSKRIHARLFTLHML